MYLCSKGNSTKQAGYYVYIQKADSFGSAFCDIMTNNRSPDTPKKLY